ncbi:hypothetical protein RND81_06G076500 [Saponaria officinalis]|uniref:Uncharacterized protein n=1 Tax=Saponaria officinalis TaxID=3572 RepID=A0AAW1K8Y4_SAPOF
MSKCPLTSKSNKKIISRRRRVETLKRKPINGPVSKKSRMNSINRVYSFISKHLEIRNSERKKGERNSQQILSGNQPTSSQQAQQIRAAQGIQNQIQHSKEIQVIAALPRIQTQITRGVHPPTARALPTTRIHYSRGILTH